MREAVTAGEGRSLPWAQAGAAAAAAVAGSWAKTALVAAREAVVAAEDTLAAAGGSQHEVSAEAVTAEVWEAMVGSLAACRAVVGG